MNYLGKMIRHFYMRDVAMFRAIKRVFLYPYFRFQHYRLQLVRQKMAQLKEFSKKQMIEKTNEMEREKDEEKADLKEKQKQFQWKWVYVLKQDKQKITRKWWGSKNQ